MTEFYVVAERWRGDDGLIVAGPLESEAANRIADRREEEADDYAVVTIGSNALELYELTGHELDRLEDGDRP